MTQNNLLNVRAEDEIYDSVWDILKKYVPDVKGELLKFVVVDSYFLHYSIKPRLIEFNENEKLEKVRTFMEKYTHSKGYLRIKPLTTLNEEMSLIHSITLLRELLRLMKKGEDVEESLKKAYERAGKAVNNAGAIREFTGEMPGKTERLLKLVEETLEADVSEILALARKLSGFSFVRLSKKRGLRGDEISGYTLTKRVEKALPRELALPDELFLRKATEGYLCREMLSFSEGAFYVLLDVSGSMKGERTVWSRAVALSLFKLAKRKKREFFLRFFNDSVFPLLKDPFEVVESLLKLRSGGGTNLNLAIARAIDDMERFKDLTNTIVLITDGKDDVANWRKELKSTALVSVMIQGHNEELKRISDRYLRVELTVSCGKKLLRVADFANFHNFY